MSVVGLTTVIAAAVALVAAGRVVQLVLASRSDEVPAVRRAVVAHGVACLVFVAVALVADPFDLPLAVALAVGVVGTAWAGAWVLIGRTYGLDYDAEPSSRVGAWPEPARRAERWARRSVGAHSPPRR